MQEWRKKRSAVVGRHVTRQRTATTWLAELKEKEEMRKRCHEVEKGRTMYGATRKIEPLPINPPFTSPENEPNSPEKCNTMPEKEEDGGSSGFTDLQQV